MNKSIFLVAAFIFFIGSVSAQTSQLMLHYTFDGDGNTVQDLSGNNRHGTLYGVELSSASPGNQYGKSAKFGWLEEDYISVANSAGMSFGGSQAVTVCFNWKSETLHSVANRDASIISKGVSGNNKGLEIGTRVTGSSNYFGAGVATQSFTQNPFGTSGSQNIPWRFDCIVYNPSESGNKKIKMYTNSQLIDYSDAQVSQTNEPLLIGARSVNGVRSGYFDGLVDTLSVWSGALTEQQIKNLERFYVFGTLDGSTAGTTPQHSVLKDCVAEILAGSSTPIGNCPLNSEEPPTPPTNPSNGGTPVPQSCVPGTNLQLRIDFNDNLNDYSGNGRNGQRIGAGGFYSGDVPPIINAGKSGLFDGDDYVKVLNSESLLRGGVNEKSSVCFWTKHSTNGLDTNTRIISKGISTKENENFVRYGIEFIVRKQSRNVLYGSSPKFIEAQSPPSGWIFICGVFNPQLTDRLKIYVNGELKSTSTTSQIVSTYEPLLIGAISNNGNIASEYFFSGRIDEVTIWDKDLTQLEINKLHSYYLISQQSSCTRLADNDGTFTPSASAPTCNPNWVCSDWSFCSVSGIQTRTCNDSNNCGVNQGMPDLSRTCTQTNESSNESEQTEDSTGSNNLNSGSSSQGNQNSQAITERIRETDGTVYYQDSSGNTIVAKPAGNECVENHECVSNLCTEGVCSSLKEAVEGKGTPIKKIICFLANPFSFWSDEENNSYLFCVADA